MYWSLVALMEGEERERRRRMHAMVINCGSIVI